MDRSDWADWVSTRLGEVLGKDPTGFPLPANLADVGVDSVDLIEIVTMAEREHGIRIEDDELHDLITVGDVIGLLDSRAPDP